jgi:23S rRNA pseudouridine1911/1915/1917 synthase
MIRVTATDANQGLRLDVLVAEKLNVSRAFAHKLIEDGKVKVNKVAEKPSYHVRAADKVIIDFDSGKVQIPNLNLRVIYEDNDCIVIDKPAGVLSHNKGQYNPEATVATWLSPKVRGLEGNRAGIVHRLDRSTSGVMIAAKNPEALSWLQKQFSQRKVKKTYMAVVEGKPEPPAAVIDMPIERNPRHPTTFRASSTGKPAITNYQVVRSNAKYSLVELQPVTGRTHQLRVHLKQLGHPIVGDVLYGGVPADRVYLHAQSLEITLPNKERKVFESSLPSVFSKMVG